MATSDRPFRKRQASTIFLRVPSEDWPYVASGKRREFRASLGNAPQLWNVAVPTFCVCFRKRTAADAYDTELMVLEEFRQEKLGGITDEGLVLAGYHGPRDQAYKQFRRDWCLREKRKFPPMRNVCVYRVRPVRDSDRREIADRLVSHLYGEFLGAAQK